VGIIWKVVNGTFGGNAQADTPARALGERVIESGTDPASSEGILRGKARMRGAEIRKRGGNGSGKRNPGGRDSKAVNPDTT